MEELGSRLQRGLFLVAWKTWILPEHFGCLRHLAFLQIFSLGLVETA